MAIGDLVGELKNAYMTNEQRAALALKGATGPIARASQQAPKAVSLLAAAPIVAGQTPAPPPVADLSTALTNPTQFARPPQPSGPQSLEAASPIGVTPTATSPSYPTTSQVDGPRTLADLSNSIAPAAPPLGIQPAQDLASAGNGISLNALPPAPPGGFTPINDTRTLDSAYRQTGAGTGNNAIVGRVGANGVPEFSNAPADLRSAGDYLPINNTAAPAPSSLSDADRIAAPSSGPQFAALGSAANMGDGVGGFSQFNQGDAALAASRFQRANDLRDGYKNQDRLDNAVAAKTRDNNFTVVHDGTRPVSQRDIKFDQGREVRSQSLADAVTGAQAGVQNGRQGIAADQQQRQANRLEDSFVAATSPNATPEDKQRYRTLTDPTGANDQARRATEAKIAETQANTAKITGEATGTAPGAAQKAEAAKNKAEIDRLDIERRKQELNGTAPGTELKQQEAANKAELDRLEIERRKTVAATTAKTLVDQKAGSIDIAKEARDLANGIAKDSNFSDITGPISSRIPTTSGQSQDLVNKANRLQSLLTLDNLKLMSGVLTDKDIDFLGRIGSGLNVTENGIKGSVEGTRKRLGDIANSLSAKISTYEKSNPTKPAAASQAMPAAPQATAVEPVRISTESAYAALPSGAQYIDPQGNHRSKP